MAAMNFARALPPAVLKLGSVVKRAYFPDRLPSEALEEAFVRLYPECRPFTMTSWERLYAAYQAVRHVCRHNIPGAVVECGVWRGGSSMMMARALLEHFGPRPELYLYDTFDGMVAPTEKDGAIARAVWDAHDGRGFCLSPLDEVRANMRSTKYPDALVRLVQGTVETTIPAVMPDAISILRLDTDWYESTLHELTHLYPRLVPGGALIIDDYGCWEGARRAVDEYFEAHRNRPLLSRIDATGRMAIKTH
jgi:O-methyltransferase